MLKVNNLVKSYNKKPVLQIDSMEFEKGIYWIRGENGCGKSTFLKCIAGLLSFDGDISLDNVSLKAFPSQYLKSVNFSETEPTYPDFLSGYQLIKFFADSKEINLEETEKNMIDFEMSPYIHQEPISVYSSGMLKKLSLILTLIGNPKVLLLDEPYITLDQKAILVLNEIIVKQSYQGKTIILTSHLDELPFQANEINLNKI